ncbi:MAG: HAD family hydrolase, partial [Zetaproteobacteria bacterium]
LRGFVFDLDGTLVDALPDIHANINRALAATGHDKQMSIEQTRPFVGGGARLLAAGVLGLAPDHPEVDRLYRTFMDIYAEHPVEKSTLYPGVRETLTALKARGVRLGCVTNKPAKARTRVLAGLGLDRLLDYAVSPEDGFAPKPDPGMIAACIKAFGLAPSEVAMVGDSDFDMEAGAAAGCGLLVFCRFGYQPLGERWKGRVQEIDAFGEILELMDGDD